MVVIQNFINGKLVPPISGEYFDNSSPIEAQYSIHITLGFTIFNLSNSRPMICGKKNMSHF